MINILALLLILSSIFVTLIWLIIRVIVNVRLIQYKTYELDGTHSYTIQVRRRGVPIWIPVRSHLKEEDAYGLFKYYKGLIDNNYTIIETAE